MRGGGGTEVRCTDAAGRSIAGQELPTGRTLTIGPGRQVSSPNMARGIAGAGGGTIALTGADPQAVPSETVRPGIVDLYAAVLASLATVARRLRIDLVTEAILIGAYFVLR